MTLIAFLAYEFFKIWNYVADNSTDVCLCIQAFSRFVSIDERMLNSDTYRCGKWNEHD